jgi:predicted CXXCH cytochrome family protein
MKINNFVSLLAFFILLGCNYALAQISPGDLSKVHAGLEGVSNCTKCHSVGNQVTREKCLECHEEIQFNIIAKKGYHASAEVNGKNCISCHSDHQGKNFNMIKFDKKTFNHALTGFQLKGQHAKAACVACHKTSRISNPIFKKRAYTYLGLNSNCLSCHDDFHQGKLSSNCAECHNFNNWKNPKAFDHSKTRFPLLGKHLQVKCINCHKTELVDGNIRQNFKNLSSNNCTPCHKDVHQNRFGQNCKLCHTEESFMFNKGMKAFDHDKTNFKLIGQHRLVDCKQCHKTTLTAPQKHDKCQDCHVDYHKGEFSKNGISPDCNQCHTNDGFAVSTFTIQKHNESNFKLDGAHLATACNACHKTDGKNWHFKPLGQRCVDCHTDVHKGYIEGKYFPNEDCTTCHRTDSWTDVNFDHNLTGFKLEGQHALIVCSDCHYQKNEKGIKKQEFKGKSTACSSCHIDSHAGQFAEKGKTDCTRCHGFDSWTDSKFDHNTYRFKIDGKHVGVKCEACHKTITNEHGKYVQYKFDEISCFRCHS